MCKLGRKNKTTKTIIIEDGVVNPNEMCIITVPRNKESVVLYAKKREMAGPNVDRPKPMNTFNPMDELLFDRQGRSFGRTSKKPKVVPRAERYDNFRKALERNIKRTEKKARINPSTSHTTDDGPTRYDKSLNRMSKNASLSFMPQASSTLREFDVTSFEPLLASTMNPSEASASNRRPMTNSMRTEEGFSFGSPNLRTRPAAIEEDDFEYIQSFQPDYSNYPQTPPPWQFQSNNTYNPAKTFTIMPPDNRHFQQSKSSDFDECPSLAQPHYSYEDEYSDVIGSGSFVDGNYEGSCYSSRPPDNQNYYSLIEESQDNSGNTSTHSKDIRTRQSNSFVREHELVSIYNEEL